VVHRALSILFTDPQVCEAEDEDLQLADCCAEARRDDILKRAALVTPTLHPEQLIEDASTVYMAPEAI
jgi:hypothetical protein